MERWSAGDETAGQQSYSNSDFAEHDKEKQVAKYIDRYFDFPDYRSSDGDRVLWLWTGKMESCKRSDFLREL